MVRNNIEKEWGGVSADLTVGGRGLATMRGGCLVVRWMGLGGSSSNGSTGDGRCFGARRCGVATGSEPKQDIWSLI